MSEGLERRRDVEKSFDRKVRAGTKILDFYFSSSSRDKNSEDSFNFLEGWRDGEGGKINDRGDTLAVEMLLGQMENFIAV